LLDRVRPGMAGEHRSARNMSAIRLVAGKDRGFEATERSGVAGTSVAAAIEAVTRDPDRSQIDPDQ
jgi:hypothetical protein